ncbi:MAG: LysR family transcriptional regulator [Thermodesulfobacteriota bacterium]
MDFTFEQINAFYAVATSGSFSGAAEKIFRTQSAVSIQVARLEETIGRRLIHRTTKNIELTEAGKVFLGYVEKIRGLLAEARQELLDLEKMERGRLTISTSDTTACYLLPGILQAFKKDYPGIEILVRNTTSLRTIEMVAHNEVDMGIATLTFLKPGLEAIPLFPRFDVVICHPEHPLAQRKQVLLKDLEKHAAILLDEYCASRRILDQACQKQGVKLSIAMELSSIEVIKNLVMIKSGISIVPEIAVRKEVQSGLLSVIKIKDFKPNQRIQVGVVYKKNRYVSLAAQSFLNMLKSGFPLSSQETGG